MSNYKNSCSFCLPSRVTRCNDFFQFVSLLTFKFDSLFNREGLWIEAYDHESIFLYFLPWPLTIPVGLIAVVDCWLVEWDGRQRRSILQVVGTRTTCSSWLGDCVNIEGNVRVSSLKKRVRRTSVSEWIFASTTFRHVCSQSWRSCFCFSFIFVLSFNFEKSQWDLRLFLL